MREALKVTIDTKTVTSISIEKDYKNRDVMELKTVH